MRTPIRLWADLAIARKALFVVAIPVLPLILTAALYFQSSIAFEAAREATTRAWQNRVAQAQLSSLVVETESAVRGYLLSGNRTLLDYGQLARTTMMTRLDDLEAYTRDPNQRERLPRLRELVQMRLDALDALLRSYDTSGLNPAEMLRHVDRGAAAMKDLRAHIDAMAELNAQILEARATRGQRLQEQSRRIVGVGAAGGVLGGVIAALLFTTGITRRLGLATKNMTRLSAREPLLPVAASRDEIGVLTAGTERAHQMLAQRDTELQQRMQELEHLTRELEAFSYSVSHDLRAPLRHIVGFASMLDKSAGPSLTEQQRRYLRTIVNAAAQMGQLIDDLLAFSRTGRTELRRVPVNVEEVVRDVQQQLMSEVNGRQLEWRVHPLPRVHGDPALIRVVFDNLLANAIKYTRARERAEIEIGSRPGENGEAILYVRDNGVGFDMRYQDKLFGVFQRLHSSDDFEGTGIGLATVRRIVTRHSGRAWAEGRPGEGATFYIALPAEENAA
jgi:signal transduction histidine kinase